MWVWSTVWWPVLLIPVWFSFGFVVCAVLVAGRVEDERENAIDKWFSYRFQRDERVRDEADLMLDGDDW